MAATAPFLEVSYKQPAPRLSAPKISHKPLILKGGDLNL